MPPAVVLCGGLGTRLRPAVADRPKVLAPVAGAPFLDYVLHYLHGQSVTAVILSVGYRADMVRDFAGDGNRWGLRLQYAEEPEPLGTGGALRFAADTCDLSRPFLALNGDTFFDGALPQLVRFYRDRRRKHGSTAAAAAIALTHIAQADRYGAVETDDEDAITAFREKDETAGAAWINAGAYVLTPKLLADAPPGEVVSLERNVFPRYVQNGLFGCSFPNATFLDIGTPDDYARAENVLSNIEK